MVKSFLCKKLKWLRISRYFVVHSGTVKVYPLEGFIVTFFRPVDKSMCWRVEVTGPPMERFK